MSLQRQRRQGFSRELSSLFDTLLDTQTSGDDSVVDTSQWAPAVDLKEEDNRFVLLADLPGVEKKDIDISLDKDNLLTLRGERKFENIKESDGYTRVERQHGTFYRRFSLPETADGGDIQASYKQGVLELSIPKKPMSKPRRIQVSGGD